MEFSEFDAGPNQVIVVYVAGDTGAELDPEALFSSVAEDAVKRAANGFHIVSTAVMPTRHSAVALGRDGSGYETKASIAVVYGK
jgi:hypothetical protein